MTSIDARFWEHVQKSDGCWEWQGARDGGGYGYFSSGSGRVRAHRFSYTLANGPIPDGLYVCHTCDNPPCVRLDHLWLGTRADNNRDRDRKGRAAVLTPERARSLTARFDWATVQAIRAEPLSVSERQLGIKYGMSESHAGNIRRGKTPRPSVMAALEAERINGKAS